MGGLMQVILQRTDLAHGIGVIYLALSVGLLLPTNTFASNSAFVWVMGIVPEWGLGLVSLAVGGWATLSANRPNIRSRYWAMLAATGLSTFYVVLFWHGNPLGIGIWYFGGLMLVSVWAALDAAWRAWWMK